MREPLPSAAATAPDSVALPDHSPDSVPLAIQAARDGNGESFGELSERCRAYLLHVANGELGDDLRAKVGASDLVQETLTQAQQSFGRFRGETEEELLAWLRQILLRNAAQCGRRYRSAAMRDVAREAPLDAPRGAAPALPPDLSTPSQQLMALERVAALRQAIDRLSDAHRRVIILRNVEHRSFEEIGHAMQRSPQAARKLWSRAVSALRQELIAVDISR